MSFITSIGTAVPDHRFEQSAIAAFMERAMQLDYTSSRKLKTIFRNSGIKSRYSVLDDYGKQSTFSFYSNTKDFEPFPSTQKRLMVYRDHALELSIKAIKNCTVNRSEDVFKQITHLIVVSCTGMYAPGLDIDLVRALKLKESVNRTCITFMGCYAAFNAVKIADSLCKSEEGAVILIVCTEICTIHFQKQGTEDNLLANALFADGAAAMIVQNQPLPGWNLIPEIFHNALEFNGGEHMAWNIGDLGFEMKLSTYVPDVIQKGIKKLTSTLLQKVDESLAEITYFAIHPGGKKILETIECELGITREQNEPAYAVLSQYGNMSSATIVFVLDYIYHRLKQADDDQLILSFAFGPGLTLESMLLRIHHE